MYVFIHWPRSGKEAEWVAEPVWAWWRTKKVVFMPGIELQSSNNVQNTNTCTLCSTLYYSNVLISLNCIKNSLVLLHVSVSKDHLQGV